MTDETKNGAGEAPLDTDLREETAAEAPELAEHDRLERQICRRIGCRSTAGDLVQDIFLRLWERATDWSGESPAITVGRIWVLLMVGSWLGLG